MITNTGAPVQGVRMDSDLHRALWASKRVSIGEGSSVVHTESLAVAIIASGPNLVTQILSILEANTDTIYKKLRDILKRRCAMDSSGMADYSSLVLSDDVKAVVRNSEKIREEMEDIGVGVQHVLISIISSHKIIKEIFAAEGVTPVSLKEAVTKLAKTVVKKRTPVTRPTGIAIPSPVGMQQTQQKKPQQGKPEQKPGVSIENYCRELVAEATAGKLMPVIGRDDEIDRVISILCRMTKNNPVLVGDAGVGKTAVVEGVAQRIACGAVPPAMRGRKIWHLDMSDFVAGTQFRGQFEERMKHLKDVFRENKDYILFIDEVHAMLGAGGAMGSLDAGNILKPALARGELRCIGATTEDEAKKYLSKDSALNRRFQKVIVREPTAEETVRILYGLKDILEGHHGCVISDEAIHAAVEFSGRYITERKFPDKAIDCVDEMCASSFVHKKDSSSTPVMNRHDAAVVVSKQSNIAVDMVLNADIDKALRVEQSLKNKVVGQDEAIASVAKVFKRAYTGVRDPARPIAVLFFGGQSGTGKTYVGELLNQDLFGTPDSLVRINMTEFSEKHTVSRLIGSPPGYVGFGETNQLTDRILRRPYSLLLIDEMEKAHPDVVRLFYQIFSKGLLTDAESRTVNFKNTIIIITSNIGSDQTSNKMSLGFDSSSKENTYSSRQKHLISTCKDMFGTPFINRVDEFIPFSNLSKENLTRVAEIRLADLADRLVVNKRVAVTYDSGLASAIVDKLDESHGVNANSVASVIAQNVEPLLAEILSSSSCGSSIRITVGKNGVLAAKKSSPRVKKE